MALAIFQGKEQSWQEKSELTSVWMAKCQPADNQTAQHG